MFHNFETWGNYEILVLTQEIVVFKTCAHILLKVAVNLCFFVLRQLFRSRNGCAPVSFCAKVVRPQGTSVKMCKQLLFRPVNFYVVGGEYCYSFFIGIFFLFCHVNIKKKGLFCVIKRNGFILG